MCELSTVAAGGPVGVALPATRAIPSDCGALFHRRVRRELGSCVGEATGERSRRANTG